jgi:hypothetical protein
VPHFPLRVPDGQRGDGQTKNHGHSHDQPWGVLEDEAAAGRKDGTQGWHDEFLFGSSGEQV